MPVVGEGESATFSDARGEGRTLRLRWHDDAGLVVLSLWRDGTCTASFRLPRDDVAALTDLLLAGLAEQRARTDGRSATGAEPVRTGAIAPAVRQAAATDQAMPSVDPSTRVTEPYVGTPVPDYAAPDEHPSEQEDTAEQELPSLADWIFSGGREAG